MRSAWSPTALRTGWMIWRLNRLGPKMATPSAARPIAPTAIYTVLAAGLVAARTSWVFRGRRTGEWVIARWRRVGAMICLSLDCLNLEVLQANAGSRVWFAQ